MPAVFPDGCEGTVAGARARRSAVSRSRWPDAGRRDQVKRPRRAKGPRRGASGCASPADRAALRDEMGPCGAHRRPSMCLPSAAPARTVTRVTHRRQLSAPGPRPLAGCCQPAIKYCHRNYFPDHCVYTIRPAQEPSLPADTVSEPRHSRRLEQQETEKKKAPQ
jgi:hypothetical protein